MKSIFYFITFFLFVSVMASPVNAAEFTLKVATAVSEKTSTQEVIENFKHLVEERTDGRLEVKIYPAGQVGGELEIVDKISKNIVQAGYISIMSLSVMSEKLRFLTLPYLWPSWDSFVNYMESKQAQPLYKEIEEKGFYLAQVSNISEFSPYTMEKINSLDDLKGKKLRTQESPIPIKTCEALGAKGVAHPFPDLYMSMKRGVFDGMILGAQFTLSGKLYEVCDHLLLAQTYWLPCAFPINKDWLNNLPPDVKKALKDSLEEAFQSHKKAAKEEYSKNLAELKEKGMEIKLISTPQALKHKSLTQELREKMAKKYGMESELERLEKKYEPQWEEYEKHLQWYLKD